MYLPFHGSLKGTKTNLSKNPTKKPYLSKKLVF